MTTTRPSGLQIPTGQIPTGMAPGVGNLFAALEETRRQTRNAVAGISTSLLDARHPDLRHRIGALLFHIAGTENKWIDRALLRRPLSELERDEFRAADLDSSEADELVGHGLEFYLGVLDEVRAKTESACWSLKDDLLDIAVEAPEHDSVVTPRLALTALCDHEAHHRGQIELLKRIVRSES